MPALLGYLGPRALRANRLLTLRPRRSATREPASVRYARFVTRRPWTVLVTCLVALCVVALPVTHLKLGLPDGGNKPEGNTEREAYDLFTEGFGAGFNRVLTVVGDGPDLSETEQEALAAGVTDVLKDFPNYIAVVVGLALLLLMVVFRSILVPIKAALGFLLSVGAAMGIVVWVFQDGHLAEMFGVAQPGPVVSFLPILLIGILFGLAMDYEVLLVSRMREAYVHTKDPRQAIVTGHGQSGRVVIAAAVIMIGVFAAFMLDPDPVIKSIGLALAFGVIADAFVVRMTLVPAVMALLGHRAWWLPKRLERVVPEVDIEGEKLDRELVTA